MERTVKNLDIVRQSTVPQNTVDEIVELAEGLPFEKQRVNQMNLDRGEIVRQQIERELEYRFVLTAHFQDKLVGALGVTEFGSGHNTRLLAEHELVQRNRDDIRNKLLETLRNDYPGAKLFIQYPAQNRTARRFLRACQHVTIEQETTTCYIHWPLTLPAEESSPSSALPEGWKELLPGDSPACSPRFRFYRAGDNGTFADARNDFAGNLTVFSGNHSDVEFLGQQLPTTNDTTAMIVWGINPTRSTNINEKELLNILSDIQAEGIEHLEWPVDGSVEANLGKSRGPLKIINKRVNFQLRLNT